MYTLSARTGARLGAAMSKPIRVRVKAIEELTPRIRQFTLVPRESGSVLPPFTAGAHIAVATHNGVERQYSLCNDPDETTRYVIAVQREAESRGGSLWMHQRLHVGDTLDIKPPQNNFPLADNAKSHLLIAGGIGITPVLSMVRVLTKRKLAFRLIYLSRSRDEAAFLDVLASKAYSSKTQLHHDNENGMFDLHTALKKYAEGKHVYCCGPAGLMSAVEKLTTSWPSGNVHFERFTNDIASHQAGDQPITVTLAKSRLTVEVRADQTILEALLARGLDIDYSCMEGTCGTCITKFVEGIPDHRDGVLTEQEKTNSIAICCSRARSNTLVLDL